MAKSSSSPPRVQAVVLAYETEVLDTAAQLPGNRD